MALDSNLTQDFLAAQLTAVSIVWALHSSFVWEAWKSRRTNRRLAAGLMALTMAGLASVLLSLGALAMPVLLPKYRFPNATMLSVAVSLLFVVGVGLYYVALIARISARHP
jgi:hypothetical protein